MGFTLCSGWVLMISQSTAFESAAFNAVRSRLMVRAPSPFSLPGGPFLDEPGRDLFHRTGEHISKIMPQPGQRCGACQAFSHHPVGIVLVENFLQGPHGLPLNTNLLSF